MVHIIAGHATTRSPDHWLKLARWWDTSVDIASRLLLIDIAILVGRLLIHLINLTYTMLAVMHVFSTLIVLIIVLELLLARVNHRIFLPLS